VTALQSAALSGVDVRLILPHKSDAVLTLWSTFSYINEMLKSGVKVYFYRPGFIHSKVAIVDDAISFVGSANMDFRSFEQNFELNTIVYDEETASQLIEMFENDLANSDQVEEEAWNKRSNFNKIKESIARLCSPLL
jgi:cardiolipin synthase